MCPACWAMVAMVTAGAVSTGALGVARVIGDALGRSEHNAWSDLLEIEKSGCVDSSSDYGGEKPVV
jgi:hypothetical protein